MIEFKNVYKKFNKKAHIDDVSFSIPEKSVVGIVGETGIGKTEMLKMICGFIKPDRGSIEYDEYKMGKEYYKSISYMPEIDKLNINLTVAEYLKFYCDLYNISKIDTENRIDELLDFVELYEYKDRSGYEARFTKCGICTLMKEYGLFDLVPAMCRLDYAMAEAGGASEFVREYTLASGGPYCDCGYKRKR